jgi:hypothetical protein
MLIKLPIKLTWTSLVRIPLGTLDQKPNFGEKKSLVAVSISLFIFKTIFLAYQLFSDKNPITKQLPDFILVYFEVML